MYFEWVSEQTMIIPLHNIGFHNPKTVCLLRGTSWLFI